MQKNTMRLTQILIVNGILVEVNVTIRIVIHYEAIRQIN